MKCGFTQKEIASFLSMPYRTYQNYEEGITSIPEWIYLLIKFKLDSLELYSPTKGIYKIKQIKFLVRDTFKKYKIKRAYLYGDYISKEVNESSPIQILIKSSLDDFGGVDYKINAKAKINFFGNEIMLFDKQTGKLRWLTESETVAHLMQMYQELTQQQK